MTVAPVALIVDRSDRLLMRLLIRSVDDSMRLNPSTQCDSIRLPYPLETSLFTLSRVDERDRVKTRLRSAPRAPRRRTSVPRFHSKQSYTESPYQRSIHIRTSSSGSTDKHADRTCSSPTQARMASLAPDCADTSATAKPPVRSPTENRGRHLMLRT